ncbi:MAG: DUF362 domain-containing protein [Acidobacteria bacterium]|nr:DUF362 domain-containing protein [Acidobacteriota bacterium]
MRSALNPSLSSQHSALGIQPLSRRRFVQAASALGLTSLTGRCSTRKASWKKDAYRKSTQSQVAILKAAGYDRDLTRVILDGIKSFRLDVFGKRVLLKPNLVEYEHDTVINTHPAVVGAAVEAFLKLGAKEVKVGEGPGHRRDTDGLLLASGLYPYLKDTKTQFVDLNLDDMRRLPLQSDFMGIDSLYFADTVLQSDLLVSMPKLKTHHWAGMTLSMKNLFGIVPGVKYGWPKNFLHWHGIYESIIDINSTVRSHFAIVDGIIGMEGNGPIQGTPKPVGVLVFGDDPVAVDATCVRIAGLKPEKIRYLQKASDFLGNLDETRIQQIGESISGLARPFEVIPSFLHLKAEM